MVGEAAAVSQFSMTLPLPLCVETAVCGRRASAGGGGGAMRHSVSRSSRHVRRDGLVKQQASEIFEEAAESCLLPPKAL